MPRLRFGLVLALALVIAACSSSPPASPTPPPSPTSVALNITEVRSDASRAPAGTADQQSAVVTADRDFALNLYAQLAKSAKGNLFYSPYSISTCLSMVYAGARGNTATQLASALGVAGSSDAWHGGRNTLDLTLSSPRQSPTGLDPLKLQPTNGIFGQAGFPFAADFLRVLAADYGAGLQTVDYVAAAEAARTLINGWVAGKTNDRIKELLPKGSVDDMTRLVLVNAIYFKGSWLSQFDPKQTDKQTFTRTDGSAVTADMMHESLETDYAAGDGWQAVRLPYAGNASMLVIVPDAGQFAKVEAGLSGSFVESVKSALGGAQVTLDLPKWSSGSAIDLVATLKALGITDAFDSTKADLSGMDGRRDLYVSDVLHQANVTVDERGTEAAAATAAVVGETALPAKQVHVNVDRPFIYLITDDASGEILFAGRVLDPTAG